MPGHFAVPNRHRILRALRAEHADLAQLVEHLIRNEGVGGSNPSIGTNMRPPRSRTRTLC
jgi:hypothetical protein